MYYKWSLCSREEVGGLIYWGPYLDVGHGRAKKYSAAKLKSISKINQIYIDLKIMVPDNFLKDVTFSTRLFGVLYSKQ